MMNLRHGKTERENPFATRAAHARAVADRAHRPTAHEQGMADLFPLGAGFGRRGDAKRFDASVDRAVRAVALSKEADCLERQAAAFDRGTIDAQGRRVTPISQLRGEQRFAANQVRAARVEAAKVLRGDRPQWQVPGSVWADATNNLGGGARLLILAEHRDAVAAALRENLPVPADVRAEYEQLGD